MSPSNECTTQRRSPLEESLRITPFRAEAYENKLHKWKRRPFAREQVASFLGTINQCRVQKLVKDNQTKINKERALDSEGLVLSDMKSRFTSNVFVAIDKRRLHRLAHHDLDVVYISGIYFSRVYTGFPHEFNEWVRDAKQYVFANHSKWFNEREELLVGHPRTGATDGKVVAVFFIKLSD